MYFWSCTPIYCINDYWSKYAWKDILIYNLLLNCMIFVPPKQFNSAQYTEEKIKSVLLFYCFDYWYIRFILFFSGRELWDRPRGRKSKLPQVSYLPLSQEPLTQISIRMRETEGDHISSACASWHALLSLSADSAWRC